MTLAIHTHGLTRCFAGGFGASDLELPVPACAVYGFLGPNGAGKTTTIRLLLWPAAGRTRQHPAARAESSHQLSEVEFIASRVGVLH